MALWRHSDKNSAALSNHSLDFVQTRDLTSLVNDNHVANNLKEILVYVYFGSIVNNRNNHFLLLLIFTIQKCCISVFGSVNDLS